MPDFSMQPRTASSRPALARMHIVLAAGLHIPTGCSESEGTMRTSDPGPILGNAVEPITSAGGAVALDDAYLFIPAGALDDALDIELSTLRPDANDVDALGSVLRLEPHGTQFAPPVVFTSTVSRSCTHGQERLRRSEPGGFGTLR